MVKLPDGYATHIIDLATNYTVAEFLVGTNPQSAEESFRSILRCWINVIDAPQVIIHDAGKHYVGAEFQKLASSYHIKWEEALIEAHDRISKIERAHRELRRSYTIFKEFFRNQGLSRNDLLKLSIKACNDSAGPDGLVPTLLVFGVYPRVSWNDSPTPIAQERIETIRKAMKNWEPNMQKMLLTLLRMTAMVPNTSI